MFLRLFLGLIKCEEKLLDVWAGRPETSLLRFPPRDRGLEMLRQLWRLIRLGVVVGFVLPSIEDEHATQEDRHGAAGQQP